MRYVKKDKLNKDQLQLVHDNVGLAYKMASKNFNQFEYIYSFDDRLGDCFYALCNSAYWYDEKTGYQFSTYACNSMYRAMERELSKIQTGKQNKGSEKVIISSLNKVDQSDELYKNSYDELIEDTSIEDMDEVMHVKEKVNSFIEKLDELNKLVFLHLLNDISSLDSFIMISAEKRELKNKTVQGKGKYIGLHYNDFKTRRVNMKRAFKTYYTTGKFTLQKTTKKYQIKEV